MKIRKGFVSNSSTSSFVCMTTKEISEAAEATLTDEQRAILESVLYSYQLGSLTLIGYESSRSDYASYIGPAERTEDSRNAVDNWRSAVKKLGGENPIIEVSVDM